MPLPLLAGPLLALAGRTVLGQVAKEGLDKLTGGDKKEEAEKSEEGKSSPEKTDANF